MVHEGWFRPLSVNLLIADFALAAKFRSDGPHSSMTETG